MPNLASPLDATPRRRGKALALWERYIALGVIGILLLLARGSPSADASHTPGSDKFSPTIDAKLCNDLPATFGGPALLHGSGGTCTDNRAQGAHPDLSIHYALPPGNLNFSPDTFILTQSGEFGMASDASIPNGTTIGGVTASISAGFLNNPCTNTIPAEFILYDATTDTSNTVFVSPDNFSNLATDGGDAFPGKADASSPAVVKYPSSTRDFFDPDGLGPATSVVPYSRYAGLTQIAGAWELLQLVTFSPGALKAAFRAAGASNSTHPFTRLDSTLGWTMVVLLGDPFPSHGTPSPVSLFCSPLTVVSGLLGRVDTNADGVADTNRLTAPATVGGIDGEGTQLMRLYTLSYRDLDGDGIENKMDTCPAVANVEDPYSSSGPDHDGIDSACDPTPASDTNGGDHDLDGYLNEQDNCPLAANGAAQTDIQGVGNQTESEVGIARNIAAPDGGPWTDQLGDACDSEYGLGNSDYAANGAFLYGIDSDAFCINNAPASDEDGDGWCSTASGADPNDNNAAVTGKPNADSDAHLFSGQPAHYWKDWIETYLQTDPLADCPEVVGKHDAWPPDFNMDRFANLLDILSYIPYFNITATGRSARRHDLNADGWVGMSDVLSFIPLFNIHCSPP